MYGECGEVGGGECERWGETMVQYTKRHVTAKQRPSLQPRTAMHRKKNLKFALTYLSEWSRVELGGGGQEEVEGRRMEEGAEGGRSDEEHWIEEERRGALCDWARLVEDGGRRSATSDKVQVPPLPLLPRVAGVEGLEGCPSPKPMPHHPAVHLPAGSMAHVSTFRPIHEPASGFLPVVWQGPKNVSTRTGMGHANAKIGASRVLRWRYRHKLSPTNVLSPHNLEPARV